MVAVFIAGVAVGLFAYRVVMVRILFELTPDACDYCKFGAHKRERKAMKQARKNRNHPKKGGP